MRLSYSILLLATSLTACGVASTQADVEEYASTGTEALSASSQTYQIVAVSSGQALDVVGVSTANGAQVQQWPYWAGPNQQWHLVQGSQSGTLGIISVNSGRALDVPNGTTAQGTLVQQWDFWNGPMQNWRFLQQSDGNYEIVNLASGLCLDVISGSTAQGTRVEQWGCWGGPMQRWKLIPVNNPASATQAPAAPSTSAPTGSTNTSAPIAAIDFQAPANASFKISDYGAALQNNKAKLEAAINATDASQSERALVVAMAMLETTDMDPSQRDGSKDGTASANVSILNLNADMVISLGYQGSDNGASLNNPANLSQAVKLLLHGFRTWGIPQTLNFQRGGRTAFNDGVSYGAAAYRSTIATIYGQIAADASLLNDGRRIEVYLVHV